MRARAANILEEDTQRGPQIIRGRTVTAYAVLFRLFSYKYTKCLYVSQGSQVNETKYSAKDSNAFPFGLTVRSGKNLPNIPTYSVF